MYQIVYPTDWQIVGPSPEITLRAEGETRALSLSVLRQDEFRDYGAERAPVVAELTPVKGESAALLAATVTPPLPDGNYVLVLRRRGAATALAVSGIRVRAGAPAWEGIFRGMLERRAQMLRLARSRPAAGRGEAPLFSLITTVYDTDPAYFNELTGLVIGQSFPDFEWLLLDNGSQRPETVAAVKSAAERDPRIRYHRVERNIHIIPGNRYLLERARGRYVIPLDSDDLLYPDALEILSLHCLSDAPADLYFSDEQKVTWAGAPAEFIWRPDWSPLYSLSVCPAAHVMAYRRELALEAGAYSGDYAQGSHDWDTFLRLTDAGATARHVAEVLYGWRMHPASSALSESSKDYLERSQLEVLRHSLRRRGIEDRFAVRRAREHMGYYHLARARRAPPRVAVDLILRSGGAEAFRNLLHNLRHLSYPDPRVRVLHLGGRLGGLRRWALKAAALGGAGSVSLVTAADEHDLARLASEEEEGVFAKAIIDCSIRIADPDWLWDAVGTLELDAGTGIVSGPVLSERRAIHSIGYTAGIDGFFATPRPAQELYSVSGTLGYLRRHVTAVYGGFVVLRGGVCRQAGPLIGVDGGDALYGIEFCLRCSRLGIRAAYTPRMRGERRAPLAAPVGVTDPGLRHRIISDYADSISSDRYYSPHLDRSSARWGELPLDAVAAPGRDPDYVIGSDPGAPALRLLSPALPLNLDLRNEPAAAPRLNVLIPGLAMRCMSGGPNTALNLTYRMAAQGVAIRYIATDVPPDPDLAPLWRHLETLSGIGRRLPNVEIVSGHDRGKPLRIGPEDVFFATAWWTAQMVKDALPRMSRKKFIYLIQDYEPGLHQYSTRYAMALETYGLDFVPIVNHPLLFDYFAANRVGRFRDPGFCRRAGVLNPAIDRTRFYWEGARPGRARKLLFYARPHSADRNLFELGVAALHVALRRGVFDGAAWEFHGIGDSFEPVPLDAARVMAPLPWMDFDAYARELRSADILLSLMLSPHPSYPPLEMAACGGIAVTNSFDCKTPERLVQISRNIVAAEPAIDAIVAALSEAVKMAEDCQARERHSAISAPGSWDESLSEILPFAMEAWRECRGAGGGPQGLEQAAAS
ncbi:MAG: glycosyltransferase [Betaproteobacteria bacterium]|nr:glycosyltransferase [Betaproteobacteria bacterium]